MVTLQQIIQEGRIKLARFASVTVNTASSGELMRANPLRVHREIWNQDAANTLRMVEGTVPATDTFGRIIDAGGGVVQLAQELGKALTGPVQAKAQTANVTVTVVEYEADLKPGEVLDY